MLWKSQNIRAGHGRPAKIMRIRPDFVSKGKTVLLPLRTEKLQGYSFSDLP